MKKNIILSLAATALLCGCNTIYQGRTITHADGTKETTRTLSAAWLTKQSIVGLKSSEKRSDGSERKLEIQGAKSAPDPKSVEAAARGAAPMWK